MIISIIAKTLVQHTLASSCCIALASSASATSLKPQKPKVEGMILTLGGNVDFTSNVRCNMGMDESGVQVIDDDVYLEAGNSK